MATLDTSIPLQVRQPKIISPEEARVRGLNTRALVRGEEDAIRKQTEQQTIRDLYRNSVGASGEVDAAAFDRGLATAGLGDRLPEFQKERAALGKAKVETQASQLKLARDKLDAVSGVISSVLAVPNPTHEDVNAAINKAVDSGFISPDEGAKMARGVPGQPERLRSFLVQQGIQVADASKRLDLSMPKFDEQDRGGTINEGTIDQVTGQRTAGADVQKSVSPNAQLAADTAKDLGAVTYKLDADGTFIAVPTRPGAGPIKTQSVVDAQGNPVTGKTKNLTEGQSKALLFGSRARDAAAAMDSLALKGVDMPSQIKAGAESIPIVGGVLGAAANMTAVSPEQQNVEQAQRDFVNAVLRRESGAAIGQNEFDNARKQYFPQIGDSAEVKEQKKRNRDLAVQGLLIEVPEAMRNSIGASGAAPPRAGPRPPIDAFFRKP